MARALYIHWPFCRSKCPYCDFNSHVRSNVDEAVWRKALIRELRFEAENCENQPLASIFFGGGTPSLMSPALVAALLDEAERIWGFEPGIEITLEANPTSFETERFAALAQAGVNRVSLGVQSLETEVLHFLGREHSVEEALKALTQAQELFRRVSFDLIYARPGQTSEHWHKELGRALGFGTDHLSLYQLTIEPGTRFSSDVRRGIFAPMEGDTAATLYAVTQELTDTAGLPAYEISNHAGPPNESRHNLTYWRYEDYIGIGPGAHGRRQGTATMRKRKPENWLDAVHKQGNGLAEARTLPLREQASEALLTGLRLTEGVDLAILSQRFRLELEELIAPEKLQLYCELGFVRRSATRIIVTQAGMPLLDALLAELVPAELVLQ